jgi:hypothetical protein
VKSINEEAVAAANALVAITDVEAQCRAGKLSYVEPYSLLSGKPPLAIPAKPSETGH